MTNIFISSIFSSIILLNSGILFLYIFLKKRINNIDPFIAGTFGFITIGFVSLFLNFFFPINKTVGTLFLILSVTSFAFIFFKSVKKKEIILIIFFTSLTSFLLITLANINRPDAGLYHLPYISILQENKIMLGLTNLHYRFGHTSIFQYISAIYNNFLFKNEFLTLPLASLVPFFILFLFRNFNFSIKKKNEIEIVSIFLIIIFSLYSFNRYSNLGNDAPASIFFFVLIITMLKIENFFEIKFESFFYLLIISIFLLTIKPSMTIMLVLPIFLFMFSKNKIGLIKNRKSIICIIILFSWILKNILISGCAIFPLKLTCFEKMQYYNEKITATASAEAEAWSKGFPDSNKKLNFDEYNSNFNWTKAWFNNHFNKIIEKLSPFLIILILLFVKKIIYKSRKDSFSLINNSKKSNLIVIIFFSLYCCIIWFLKFPVYRFGMAFISSLIIFIFVFFLVDENKPYLSKKIYYSIIFIGLILFYGKNLNRIISKTDIKYNNFPWPKIYTLGNKEENIKKTFSKISDKNGKVIYYYSGGQECMYSKSPCSNYNRKLIKIYTNNYSIFYLEKN